MGKWFFPSCLLAFAAKLTDKKMLTFLIFTGLVMKSHTFFLLATVNVSPPPTADNKKDWGGVGGWKQLEAKSNLP